MHSITHASVYSEKTTMDVIAEIEASNRSDTVEKKVQSFAEGLGLQNVACLEIAPQGGTGRDHVLMNTRPNAWTNAYFEQNHVTLDPVVTELDVTWLPFSWDDVRSRRKLSREELEIVDSARDFGMSNGFVVPVVESSGYSGIVSYAGDREVLTDETRASLTLVSFYAHNKLRFFRKRACGEDGDTLLTRREAECLSWVAVGKSDWQIGQILSVSQKTVNFHIENVKRKYGVATRMQAVVSAIRQGQLSH